MVIKIGTGNRVTFPKVYCNDNDIKYGDEFELLYDNGNIILKRMINSVVGTSKDVEIKSNQDIIANTVQNELTLNENNKSVDITNNVDIINEEIIDCNTLPLNFYNLNKIPLNKFSEFKPNIIDSLNYTSKCYSECGLICKTNGESIKIFCSECKGDMLDESVKQQYCVYFKDINKSSNKDKSINKESVSNIKKNVSVLNNNLDNKINLLKKVKTDLKNNISSKENTIHTLDDLVTIKLIHYSHHHQCYNCEEYYDIGFIIDDDHFYCRHCSSELFKDYMRKRGKLKNV